VKQDAKTVRSSDKGELQMIRVGAIIFAYKRTILFGGTIESMVKSYAESDKVYRVAPITDSEMPTTRYC
jgi:hypothetical protein